MRGGGMRGGGMRGSGERGGGMVGGGMGGGGMRGGGMRGGGITRRRMVSYECSVHFRYGVTGVCTEMGTAVSITWWEGSLRWNRRRNMWHLRFDVETSQGSKTECRWVSRILHPPELLICNQSS
jgi:hypothetical protein